ncbi:MAG: phosphatidylserine/phosphatidylglycerophosphate/cardiolipin synthase family protein [Oscillospiraceae bacterium]
MKTAFKITGILLLAVLAYVLVCLTVPPLFHHPTGESEVPPPPESTAQERVLCIDQNGDALMWRLRLIEAARERLVLTTFDFRDDHSGQDIMAALLHAAQRGVQVKILVDGMNGSLWLPGSENFQELAAHEGVEVKLYNPITLLKPWANNYRMHDKYLIADDFAYILGGRNTDDLFLGDYVDTYNEDKDILVYEAVPGEGRSYTQLLDYFEQIWNLPCCKLYKGRGGGGTSLEEHYDALRETRPQAFTAPDWESATMETNGVTLYTNPMEPENKQPRLWDRLVEEMKQGGDVAILTPYIICSRSMYRDLTDVASGASRVDLIINAVESGSNPFGCTDYLNQKKNVRETGVQVYEYLSAQAMHTKTILVGDSLSIVGSCNLDMRSVYLDTEMMLRIDCPELNAVLRSQAEELREHSRHIAPDGTVTDGAAYQPAGQSAGKNVMYGLLRVLILPLRHLL